LRKKVSSIRFLDIFFVHFLKIFSTLVQIESKNNKNILGILLHVFESIMQRLKKGTTVGDFWAQKKLKKRHQC